MYLMCIPLHSAYQLTGVYFPATLSSVGGQQQAIQHWNPHRMYNATPTKVVYHKVWYKVEPPR